MISFLLQLKEVELISFALVLNLILVLSSILFYKLCGFLFKGKQIQSEQEPILLKDIGLVVVVLLCNVIIFILGFKLYQFGFIQVSLTAKWSSIIVQVLVLVLLMDLLMYFFHRIAHLKIFYSLAHKRHHYHMRVNCLSLFVLHPFEALGFGFIFIFCLFIYSFSVEAIAIYLLLNLLWGTLGHLNEEILTHTKLMNFLKKNIVGLTLFHNHHHQYPNYNFGFYTVIWDKFFGTYFKG